MLLFKMHNYEKLTKSAKMIKHYTAVLKSKPSSKFF